MIDLNCIGTVDLNKFHFTTKKNNTKLRRRIEEAIYRHARSKQNKDEGVEQYFLLYMNIISSAVCLRALYFIYKLSGGLRVSREKQY